MSKEIIKSNKGRPKKLSKNIYSQKCMFLLTDEQKKMLNEYLSDKQMTRSELIRKSLSKYCKFKDGSF